MPKNKFKIFKYFNRKIEMDSYYKYREYLTRPMFPKLLKWRIHFSFITASPVLQNPINEIFKKLQIPIRFKRHKITVQLFLNVLDFYIHFPSKQLQKLMDHILSSTKLKNSEIVYLRQSFRIIWYTPVTWNNLEELHVI